uniref:Urotensin II-related peptide n=1 Tax=Gouania willdenowi TaxID=441366 RepID=A0A8C5HUY3_GOUWI
MLLGMVFILMVLMVPRMPVKAAPTERGFLRPQNPSPKLTHVSKEENLKHWLLSTKGAQPDGTHSSGSKMKAEPNEPAKIRRIITALEELQKAFNSTVSSHVSTLPRARSRNSGRNSKLPLAAAEGVAKPTTAAPITGNAGTSRAIADILIPSLTGRNFRKTLPSLTKKTNKRVCFWKYCSQN